MISKKHPVCNWLRLAPHEHRHALDKVIQFRDSSDNPMAQRDASGGSELVLGVRVAQAAARPDVRNQALERLQELQGTRLRLGDQITMQAGALLEQQAAVELEHQQLAALVEVPHG